MKIEVEFEGQYETGEPLAKPIGRIVLGPHIARVMFCPDGHVRMAIDKQAIDQGFVIVTEYISG